jgi:hypothetical protein
MECVSIHANAPSHTYSLEHRYIEYIELRYLSMTLIFQAQKRILIQNFRLK